MVNASIYFKTGWHHDKEVLVRPQGQKVFKCAHAILIRKQFILTPGIKLAFRE